MSPDARWLAPAEAHGAGHWLDNAHGGVRRVWLGGHVLPLVLAEDGAGASYVASPVSAWARYARHEARRRALALPAALGGGALAALMRAAWLHRPAMPGNWLVSTNLHPSAAPSHWRRLRDEAVAAAPGRPLVLRNVCAAVDPALPGLLRADGWLLVPARRVYLCDPADPAVARRNNVKNDRRALDKAQLEHVPPEGIRGEELPVLRELFRALFIAKHSALNPDFADAFFALCHGSGFLELHALRHQGRPVGVVGLLRRHGWLTVPLLGYDTGAPKALGLYRALMALAFGEARREGLRLHYSSGAGEFKRARGGEPALEYTALYVAHLPAPVRAAARLFATLLDRVATPLLERYG